MKYYQGSNLLKCQIPFFNSLIVFGLTLLFSFIQPGIDGHLYGQGAETITVTGSIRDENNDPLLGVTVMSTSVSGLGVVSDVNGNYNIRVPSNDVLRFSFIGFPDVDVAVEGRLVINVIMERDFTMLDEVVLIGYGSTRRANIVGAVASMNVEQIENYPATNLSNLLDGQMAGVSVSPAQPSGRPGASTRIVVHGTNTFGTSGGAAKDATPLYVVDGFIVEQEEFDMLDPSVIEHFSVLKDASAAVYGARGANGVVLVQTKRGREGSMRINYSGSHGISDATQQTEMLSAHDHARILNARYGHLEDYDPYTNNELQQLKNIDYNWLDDAWQTASISRHTINLSGGSNRVRYFGGGTYVYETGNFSNLDITKFSYRLGIDADILKNLTASVSITIDDRREKIPYTASVGTNTMQNLFEPLLQAPRWLPSHINGLPVYSSALRDNPFAFFDSNSFRYNQGKGNTLNTSLKYKFESVQGLEANFTYSRRENNNYSKEYSIPYNLYEFAMEGDSRIQFSDRVDRVVEIQNRNRINEIYRYNQNYQMNLSLSYNRTFGLHNLNLFSTYEQSEGEGFDFGAYANQQRLFGVETQQAFNNEQATSRGSMSEGGRYAGVWRLNYNFNNRYFFESTVRVETSTNFSPSERTGVFPAFGAAWVVSEENFFRNNVGFMDYLKLRGSFGRTGVDYVRPYEYLLEYGTGESYLFGRNAFGGISVNNLGVVTSGVSWEKNDLYNAGLDMKFFGSRLSMNVDAFYRYAFDILEQRNVTLPTSTGITRMPSENTGRLEAWGYDMELEWRENVNRNFSWFVKGIFGFNTNRVLERVTEYSELDFRYPIGRSTYSEGADQGYMVNDIIRSQAQIDAINEANRAKFGYDYTIFGQPLQVGMLYLQDIGRPGNVSIDEPMIVHEPDGRVTEEDIQYIQRVNEDLEWKNLLPTNVSLGGRYKSFSVSMQFNMRYGITNKVVDKLARTAPTESLNAPAFWSDFYTEDNPNAKYPSPRYASMNEETSAFWLRDEYLLRLRNLNVTYTLPTTMVNRWGLTSMRVFFTGTNLWTPISTFDYKEDAIARFNTYPFLKTYNFGVSLSL